MSNPSSPPKPEPLPPAGRYCDLVLQGGVVSGVVYPRAIAKLATSYWFHSLGGTSVGALAAAVTAAAEYGRRLAAAAAQAGKAPAGVTGQEGFVALDGLAKRLAEPVGKVTRLRSLFQPRAGLEALMALFVRGTAIGLKHRGSARALRLAALAVALHAPWALAGAVLVALVLAPAWTTVAAQPLALIAWGVGAAALLLIGALLGTLVAIVLTVLGPLVANHFGLCKLGDEDASPEANPGLTRWLHRNIQQLAGRIDDTPLTFAHLAAAPGGPGGGAESISLKLVTTNLTLARPFVLPLLTAGEERLFFKPEELASYFPPEVVAALGRTPYACKQLGDPPAGESTAGFFELPQADLPIVVAARLSLSFPLLISAVPLYAIDREPRVFRERRLERCWFSDGGICANFPIHFFDSAIPRWPTFGISLGARSKHWQEQPVWLPQAHWQGRGDSWEGRDEPNAAGADRLLAFFGRIVASAKDWNDRTLMRMPGVRDRVVRVGFLGSESELDIGLAAEHITSMADDYGPEAGEKLIARFADAHAADGFGRGWHEHRWVRMHTLLVGLQDLLREFETRAASPKPLAELTQQAFEQGVLEGSEPTEQPLDSKQANALDALRLAVTKLANALGDRPMDSQPYQPQPRPSLRPRPPL